MFLKLFLLFCVCFTFIYSVFSNWALKPNTMRPSWQVYKSAFSGRFSYTRLNSFSFYSFLLFQNEHFESQFRRKEITTSDCLSNKIFCSYRLYFSFFYETSKKCYFSFADHFTSLFRSFPLPPVFLYHLHCSTSHIPLCVSLFCLFLVFVSKKTSGWSKSFYWCCEKHSQRTKDN